MILRVFNILKRIVPSGDIVTAVDANGKKEVVCKSGSGGMNLKIVILWKIQYQNMFFFKVYVIQYMFYKE